MTKDLSEVQAKAALTTQTLAAAQTTTAKATSGLKLAMKGLWTTLKSFIPLAIVSAVIGGIALAIDHFIVTAKEQKEQNDELKSSYEELSGELETIATRMDEIKDRIGEINAAGPLSITDKQESVRYHFSVTDMMIPVLATDSPCVL